MSVLTTTTQSKILAIHLLACIAFLLTSPASTQRAFCEETYFWHPNGQRYASTADWSSTFFKKGPCLQVSGIGVTTTFMKTVIIVDRSDSVNSYLRLEDTREFAAAQEVNLVNGYQRGLHVLTNTFCSSGHFLSDGSFLSIGGDNSSMPIGGYGQRKVRRMQKLRPGGIASYRRLTPCSDGRCDFSLVGTLAAPRWYPTSQLLPDGRVVIVGGSSFGGAINNKTMNEPSIEYYPRRSREGPYRVRLLEDTLPYNLYPIVHLLPNGLVFIFAGKKYTLWNAAENKEVEGNYPHLSSIRGKDEIQHLYPLAGTSAMFPLTPANNYNPEIIICGGAPTPAFTSNRVPSESRCFLIQPLEEKPQWRTETMAYPRIMPLSVLLPDGHLFIHGGAGFGHSRIPNSARAPVLRPEMYNTKTRSWFKGDLGISKIVRLYHASAVLLHDGSVWISGSNPNGGRRPKTRVTGNDVPTEFRVEYYQPPYLRPGVSFPVIIQAPKMINSRLQSSFKLIFTAPLQSRTFEVVLAHPGFSTHSLNHGMRNVVLRIKSLSFTGQRRSAWVSLPTNKNILPPTWYFLFVLDNGVPSRGGHYVMIK